MRVGVLTRLCFQKYGCKVTLLFDLAWENSWQIFGAFICSFSESDPYFDAACYFWCTEKGHLPTPTDNNIQLASANITAAAVSFNGSFLLLDTRNILVNCRKFYTALMNRECQNPPDKPQSICSTGEWSVEKIPPRVPSQDRLRSDLASRLILRRNADWPIRTSWVKA